MVTHANLSANEEAMAEAFRTSSRSVFVSWLPLFHDMGLIGVVLHALHVGAHAVLMAPLDFAQKPLRWLKAVTTWKATFTGAPNFAYDLCIKKATPESLAGLDLSGLLTAFNGSEPIHAATLERFTRAFAPVGFESRMFYPCYGLAEATLFVTGGDLGAPPLVTGDDPPRVGCGRTWGDHEVLVVDPETRQPVPAGATGEVWVAGPSVAQGYWRHPEETARTFDAVRADSGRGGYLRTGDMGLLDRDELVITGRIKDLLIMEGRNLYPQDLERTIQEAHPSIRETCVAAFSIERDGRERLIVAAEVTRGLPDAEAEALKVAVKEAVSLHHQALLGDLVLLAHGTLPKTSSGKVRRQACRDAYLSGAWSVARP